MARTKKRDLTVQEAAAEADKIILENSKKVDTGAPIEEDLNPIEEGKPVEDEVIHEDLEGYDFSNLEDEPPVEQQPSNESKEIQRKYDVLQGMYNTETKRLSDLLAQTMQEVEVLKGKLNKPSVPDEPAEDASIETLKEEYPALYKAFMALAKQEVQREVGSAMKDTTAKVDAIQQRTEVDSRNVYYQRLAELVPGYEQINSHPAFLKWLSEPVSELSPVPRRDFLTRAFNSMDAAGTAKFFNAFIKEKGVRVKGKFNPPDDIVAPDDSGNVARVNKAGTQGTVTRAEIAKFYQDKMAGLLPGTPEEIAKREARIFQLVREGKVRAA
jgi:hypothetical protein